MKKLMIAAALCTGMLSAQAAPLFTTGNPQQGTTQQAPAAKKHHGKKEHGTKTHARHENKGGTAKEAPKAAPATSKPAPKPTEKR